MYLIATAIIIALPMRSAYVYSSPSGFDNPLDEDTQSLGSVYGVHNDNDVCVFQLAAQNFCVDGLGLGGGGEIVSQERRVLNGLERQLGLQLSLKFPRFLDVYSIG